MWVVSRDSPERVELAAARDPLDRLAAATGGRVLADHEADQLAPLLRARTRTVSRTEETPLWDTPAALILFLAIVTVEWVEAREAGGTALIHEPGDVVRFGKASLPASRHAEKARQKPRPPTDRTPSATSYLRGPESIDSGRTDRQRERASPRRSM